MKFLRTLIAEFGEGKSLSFSTRNTTSTSKMWYFQIKLSSEDV